MRILVTAVAVLMFASGLALAQFECSNPETPCFKTGCGGEVCASEPVFTLCVVTCETQCFSQANCVCAGGVCRAVGHGLSSCLKRCDGTAATVGALQGGWQTLSDGRVVQWVAVEDRVVAVERLADGREAVDGKTLAPRPGIDRFARLGLE